MTTAPDGSPLPVALYSCAICGADRSFPPDDLFWVQDLGGWYCVFCIDDMADGRDSLTIGMTLEKWINQETDK